MPKPKLPSTRLDQLNKYRPLVEMLEDRNAPGNGILGAAGPAVPWATALSAAGIAIAGSRSGGGAAAPSTGGSMYSGFVVGGGSIQSYGSPASGGTAASGGAAANGGASYGFLTTGSDLGAMGGAAGTDGADGGAGGFGGGSVVGSGFMGSANLPTSPANVGAQNPLDPVVMQPPAPPAVANAATAYTGDYIQTAGTDMFWAVKLRPGVDPGAFAASVGGVNHGSANVQDTYFIKFPEGANTASIQQRLDGDARVVWASEQVRQDIKSNFVPNDEFYRYQWHLKNTAEFGGLAGADANVQGVWDNYRGRGVNIGIVDSGVEYTHEDLAPNYNFNTSFDFTQGDYDAFPDDDYDGRSHGTSVSGVAAGRGNNVIGISGAAPEAEISGLKILGTNGANPTASQGFARNIIDIYNNSWGKAEPDQVRNTNPLWDATVEDGARFGRNGLGNIFVYSAGNSHLEGSEANYHGDRNNQYSIIVGSINNSGTKSEYSEEGANVFVGGYSNGGAFDLGIVTTTTENGYVGDFGGTSSAAPLVSGVIALVLEANPNLTWRDVKAIIAQSARKVDARDSSWVTNAAGYHHSNKYGFGAIDAGAAVALARTWVNLPTQTSPYTTDSMDVGLTIPQFQGLTRNVYIPQNFVVEHVEVYLTATHQNLGEIAFSLTSPSGTTQQVGALTALSDEGAYVNQRFGFVGYLGEQSQGQWSINVRDIGDTDGPATGQFIRWSMRLYGYQPQGGVIPPGPGPGGGSDGTHDSRYENNNSDKKAYNLGTLSGSNFDLRNLAIAVSGDKDWFKLTTARAGALTAEINITGNPVIHVKLYRYDAKAKKLVELGKGQGTKQQPGGIQSVSAFAAANTTIYVQVLGYQKNKGNYNLKISQL